MQRTEGERTTAHTHPPLGPGKVCADCGIPATAALDYADKDPNKRYCTPHFVAHLNEARAACDAAIRRRSAA